MKIAVIAATAALGGLLFGYDTGVISERFSSCGQPFICRT